MTTSQVAQTSLNWLRFYEKLALVLSLADLPLGLSTVIDKESVCSDLEYTTALLAECNVHS